MITSLAVPNIGLSHVLSAKLALGKESLCSIWHILHSCAAKYGL